jgi:hypothetical protein
MAPPECDLALADPKLIGLLLQLCYRASFSTMVVAHRMPPTASLALTVLT